MYFLLCLIICMSLSVQTNPPPRSVITPENVHQLAQIVQIGRGWVYDIALSDDERYLQVISRIGIWEYNMTDLTTEPTFIWQPPIQYADPYWYEDSIKKALFTSDNQIRITLDNLGIIRFWDVQTDIEIAVIREHSSFRLLGIAPNGEQIVTGNSENMLIIWDMDTFRQNTIIYPQTSFDRIQGIGFHPNGDTFLAYKWLAENPPGDMWFIAYDTVTWQIHHQIQLSSRYFVSTQFHPTEPILFFTNASGILYSWDYKADIYTEYSFGKHYQFAFIPQYQQIVYVPYRPYEPITKISVANSLTEETQQIFEHPSDIGRIYFSEDNRSLVAQLNEQLWVWDVATWTPRLVLDGYFITFMPTSHQIWVGVDYIPVLIDTYTGDVVHTLTIPQQEGFGGIVFSPDGRLVTYISDDNALNLIDTQTDTTFTIAVDFDLRIVGDGGLYFPYIQFSPDGRYIIVHGAGVLLVFGIV